MPKKKDVSHCSLDTKLVRGGSLRSEIGETSEALYLNSAYVYGSAEEAEGRFAGTLPGFKYGRYSHPNLAMLEERLALMEGAERCIVTASGMAAVFASLMSQLKAGDHVIADRTLFSSCFYILTQLLPRFGVATTLIDGSDLKQWKKALQKNTRAAFIETPANPTLGLIDIREVAKLCKKNGTKLIVDNVLSMPLTQRPLELGADLVIYSTTKHIDGQGRTLGGAIIGDAKLLDEVILPFCRHTGPHMSPFTAWVLLKSLETLPMRVERHAANAKVLAALLEKHPKVTKVIYPGLVSHPQRAIAKKQMSNGGPMIAFELKGGKKAAFKFMNALKLIDISNNLGDAKTLVTHPASSTHFSMGKEALKAAGIGDGLIRISVGIEDVKDLSSDITQALKAA